jgi:hypothetical protein
MLEVAVAEDQWLEEVCKTLVTMLVKRVWIAMEVSLKCSDKEALQHYDVCSVEATPSEQESAWWPTKNKQEHAQDRLPIYARWAWKIYATSAVAPYEAASSKGSKYEACQKSVEIIGT